MGRAALLSSVNMGWAALLNRSLNSKIHKYYLFCWYIYTYSNIFILYQEYLLAIYSFQAHLIRDKGLEKEKIPFHWNGNLLIVSFNDGPRTAKN